MNEEQGAAHLVGREGELGRLEAALCRAASDGGSVALVAGEAGSGRTRLCEELGRRHAARGGLVLLGRALPEDAAEPLGPVADALRAARRREPALWAAVTARAGVLGAALPELAGTRAGDQAAVGVGALQFEALLDAVDDAAAGRTALWVVDDLHWADGATWAFVRYSARRVADLRLVVAATYREEELGPAHPWWTGLARLRREPRVDAVRLPRLGPADAARLGSAVAPGLTAAALAEVVARSAGTPLMIEELARMAAAGGGPAGVPDAALALVRERVALLSPAARELLHVAAVAGAEVDEALLAALRPRAAVGDLVAAGLLELAPDPDRLRFRHPLLREAACREVPLARRCDLAREIAEARQPEAETGGCAAAGLSARELEVARLVAEGLTNPAIAGRLFLSRPTVASHVAHILAKLDFSSRSQIAAWVVSHRPADADPRADLRVLPGA